MMIYFFVTPLTSNYCNKLYEKRARNFPGYVEGPKEARSLGALLWVKGGLSHRPPKFEHIFVIVITFSPFLLCK